MEPSWKLDGCCFRDTRRGCWSTLPRAATIRRRSSMRFPHPRLATMLRSRSAALAVGAAVLVTVVAANQPHDQVIGHPQSAAAASRIRADSRAAPPPLRTLQRRVEFGDASASHPGAPAIAADTGILVDLDTRSIIWERNPHLAHAPASTTKIVSTLVALVNFTTDR